MPKSDRSKETNLQYWVSTDLFVAFKTQVLKERRTMRDVMIRFMKVYCDYQEPEEGKANGENVAERR